MAEFVLHKNGTAFEFKTWIQSGYTPWKVGYFTHGYFIAGSSGYPDHFVYTTPGGSPSYIPTLYIADAVGQLAYGNMSYSEPFVGDGSENYTVPNGPNGMFSLLASKPSQTLAPNEIRPYYFAWPMIKSGDGIWWSEGVTSWD